VLEFFGFKTVANIFKIGFFMAIINIFEWLQLISFAWCRLYMAHKKSQMT